MLPPPKVHQVLVAAALSALAGMATAPTLDAAPAGVAEPALATSTASIENVRSAGRRTCPLGQHYSTYYRRCVWWLPLRT